GPRLHHGKALAMDHPPRLGSAWAMQGEQIARTENCIKISGYIICTVNLGCRHDRIKYDNPALEWLKSAGHLPADAPKADDAARHLLQNAHLVEAPGQFPEAFTDVVRN